MYKVMYNDDVIDVLDHITYVTYQEKNRLNLITKNPAEAYGIMSSSGEEIYHLDTLILTPQATDCKTVSLVDITDEEYEYLLKKLGLVKEENLLQGSAGYTPDDPGIDIEEVKRKKLSQLSQICNQTIVRGFDVLLSDNKTYHFDLTIEDQINIASLKELIAQGATQIPYHAAGELCRFYPVQDIMTIIEKGTEFKTYHVTYYNSLKYYVNSMTSVAMVEATKYGDPVPKQYRSEVMQALLGG